MSELKAFTFGLGQYMEDGSPCVVAFDGEKNPRLASDEKFYIKSEADKVIAEKDAEIRRLKNGIAPKQSDKTLQERLNEVCEKHGVSTLQDLDWAFCESEKRYTKDIFEAVKQSHHNKYKRCMAMAMWCAADCVVNQNTYKKYLTHKSEFRITHFRKWYFRWLELADQFKEAK